MKRIVIIGAGLSGTLLANRLCERYTVILLDSAQDIQLPTFSPDSSKLASVPTFCYGIGGTSNLWHNGLIPLNEEKISDPIFIELLNKCNKYKLEAFQVLSSGSLNCDMLNNLEQLPPNFDRIIYPSSNYKYKLDSRIKLYTNVEDVEYNVSNKKLNSIKFFSCSQQHEVLLDHVIVSCGGLNSPTVVNEILKSGNVDDSCDNKFIDHPMGFIGKIKVKKESKNFFNGIAASKFEGGDIKTCFKLHDMHENLSSCVYLRNCFSSKHSGKIAKFKSKLGSSGSMLQKVKSSFNILIFHPDIIIEILKFFFNIDIKTASFNLMFVGEQRERNSTVLQIKNRSKSCIDWNVTDSEINSYNRMIKKFIADNEKYFDSYDIPLITRDSLWSAAHYSCSVPVGKYLDARLKHKDLSNVFVCDGSVIPEHGYSNTGLLIAQLCIYLSSEVL